MPGVLGVKLFGVGNTDKTQSTVLVSMLLVHGKRLTVTLHIPPGYPSVPPEVRVKGRIPHTNLLVSFTVFKSFLQFYSFYCHVC